MKRTVSIPVDLPRERFLPLMGFCADIFNQHVDWALTEKTWNKNKAHHALYASIRQQHPDIPSALVQTIRDNAMEAVKARRFANIKKREPTDSVPYDVRSVSLSPGYSRLSLACIGDRFKTHVQLPEYAPQLFGVELVGGWLHWNKGLERFSFEFCFEDSNGILGKDIPGLIEEQSGFRPSEHWLYRLKKPKYSTRKRYSVTEYQAIVAQLEMPVENSAKLLAATGFSF